MQTDDLVNNRQTAGSLDLIVGKRFRLSLEQPKAAGQQQHDEQAEQESPFAFQSRLAEQTFESTVRHTYLSFPKSITTNSTNHTNKKKQTRASASFPIFLFVNIRVIRVIRGGCNLAYRTIVRGAAGQAAAFDGGAAARAGRAGSAIDAELVLIPALHAGTVHIIADARAALFNGPVQHFGDGAA